MNHSELLASYVTEARQAAERLPASHRIRNELAALALLQHAFPSPGKNVIEMAHPCLLRIRIALLSETYPGNPGL